MDKDEILKKSRGEQSVADEREKLLEASGAMAGLMVVFVAAVALSQVKTWVLHEPSSDLMALVFLGMGTANLYQYAKARNRQHLVGAAMFLAGAALFAFGYVMAVNGIVL